MEEKLVIMDRTCHTIVPTGVISLSAGTPSRIIWMLLVVLVVERVLLVEVILWLNLTKIRLFY